jgi:hypothetical protein
MIAAQLIAAHYAAMECYRRAMVSEQTFEGQHENLRQATKLSRASAALLEALNRHRGKGQQKVTVEHVHVHSGGQAIVPAPWRPTDATTSTAAGWSIRCRRPPLRGRSRQRPPGCRSAAPPRSRRGRFYGAIGAHPIGLSFRRLEPSETSDASIQRAHAHRGSYWHNFRCEALKACARAGRREGWGPRVRW